MKLGKSDPRNRVKTERTDRAVSPVIGVILMVAITVILAAVIGVFVLGLGDELGDAGPSNTLDVSGEFDFDDGNDDNAGTWDGDGYINVTVDSGDSFDVDDVTLLIQEDGDVIKEVPGSEATSGEDTVEVRRSAGWTITDTSAFDTPDHYEDLGEYEVEVVHEPSDSSIGSGEIDVADSSD